MTHPDLTVLDPAYTADEATMLRQYLQAQRDMVAWKLAGADLTALQAVSTASGLQALGVLRHLTAVERWWFRDRWAGQEGLEYGWTDDDPDGEYRLRPGETVDSLLADYATECGACDGVTAGRSLDQVGVHCEGSLRWVILHMVEETARHLGHIDLLREQADGSTGSDPRQVAGEAAAAADAAARAATDEMRLQAHP